MKGRRRHKSLGQALVEFCIATPVLLLFVLLTVDVGRAYWQAIDAAGAARAGVRMAIISDTSDIANSVRNEPNSGIPDDNPTWGAEGPSGSYGVCAVATATCGDPSGCASTSFTGVQIACFSVRSCTLSSGGDLGTCTSYGSWGARPLAGGGEGVQVKVVIKFKPVTPALSQVVGGSGILYLTQTSTGEELYF